MLDVRFGSKADICSAQRHVRFTPESGHVQCNWRCPLWGQLRTWVGRLLAVEDTTKIEAGVTITVDNVQTCLPVRFVASLSLGVVTSSNVATFTQGDLLMRLSSTIRAVLVALSVTGTGLATAAYAASGSIRFNVIKAGFIIGGSAGSGTLVFHGRRYPLSIGGVSYGFTFGGAATDFIGTVSNIRRPSDVNGVYGAAGAGVAIGAGAGAIVLTNQNGAV